MDWASRAEEGSEEAKREVSKPEDLAQASSSRASSKSVAPGPSSEKPPLPLPPATEEGEEPKSRDSV